MRDDIHMYDIYMSVVTSIDEKKLGKALQRQQNHVAAFIKCETPVVSLTEKKSLHIPVNVTANATNKCRV